jgi:hypothetical protein
MSRRNNPSGRYIEMTDAELARDQAAYKRAVERQRQKDEAALKAWQESPLGRKWLKEHPNA